MAPRVNILMVDDEPKNLLALEAVLGKLGQNLVRAGSGKEALRLVMKDDYALILLDVQMPEMDGFETATIIRSREKSRDTPIIFITAAGKTEEEMFRGYEAGAIDYILKPYSPAILRHKVSVLVDLHQKNLLLRAQAFQLRESEERLKEANDALNILVRELAAPVLKAHEGLLVLPVVGLIDSERARQITGDMLQAVRSHRARVVLLDISGVHFVDTAVAARLMGTVKAARLMGAEVLITGISSEIAATLVSLGAGLPDVQTFADMQTGLARALVMLDLALAKRHG